MGIPEATSNRGDCAQRRMRNYLMEDVREDMLLEAELLLLSLAIGIQDAAIWIDYALFASNQTGNLLFLAIASAGFAHGNKDVRNIAISLGTFIGGALTFGQLGNYFGPRKRLWLILSNVLQTVMVYVAVIIWYIVPDSRHGATARGIITLMAISSGAQIAMARSLRITEITTAMATSVFADAVVDAGLIRLKNRRRNRRVLFLIMLTVGCLVGGFAQKAINSAFAILLSSIVKTVVTGALFFNKANAQERVQTQSTSSV